MKGFAGESSAVSICQWCIHRNCDMLGRQTSSPSCWQVCLLGGRCQRNCSLKTLITYTSSELNQSRLELSVAAENCFLYYSRSNEMCCLYQWLLRVCKSLLNRFHSSPECWPGGIYFVLSVSLHAPHSTCICFPFLS